MKDDDKTVVPDTMDADQFRAWIERMGFKRDREAQRALGGIPLGTLRNYMDGRYPIPPGIVRLTRFVERFGCEGYRKPIRERYRIGIGGRAKAARIANSQ